MDYIQSPYKTVSTLGYQVFSDCLSKISLNNSKCLVVNTISPNSYGIATKDIAFEDALKFSDYLVLDGVYFALAPILLNGKNIQRNQGPDVFDHFINRFKNKEGKVFFLGSTEKTLEKIEDRLQQEYPLIKVKSFSPPFKTEFSSEDDSLMVDCINQFKPDLLFIGMTCPKQEKWAIRHKDQLDAKLAICIGNVFDWFAGTQKSIHPFWFKLRLGWLARIFIRPEVFKRNIGNQMIFFKDLLLIKFKLKKI